MRFPRPRSVRRSETAEGRDAGGARRSAVGVRVLVATVATCGLAFWALQVAREGLPPAHDWSTMVRGGDAGQRLEAVAGLATIEGRDVPAALPALSASVRDPNDRVAAAAAQALAQASKAASRSGDAASSRRAVAALAGALQDTRPEVRTWAALGIAGSGAGLLGTEGASTWTDPLIAALGDPEESVRLAAAKALGQVPCGVAGLAALEAALESDASPRVRSEAAQALGAFPTEPDRVTLSLMRGFRATDREVRDACSSALSQILMDPGRRRSEAVVPELARALSDAEPLVRSQAAAVLGEIGPAAETCIPALVAMLKEPEQDMTSMPTIAGASGWSPREPAGQAALSLGRIAPGTSRAGEAAAALLAALREEKSDGRRAAVAQGFSAFDAELAGPAVAMLLEILRETAGRAALGPPAPAVCLALGRLAPGSPLAADALAALLSALDSENSETRIAAAEGLGAFAPLARSALPRLRELAGPSDQAAWERPAALAAIRRIEGEPAAGEPDGASPSG